MQRKKYDPFLRCNGLPIGKEEDWFTPNTYNRNYKAIPDRPGVYLIVIIPGDFNDSWRDVVYIGSSKNLSQRARIHTTIPKIKAKYRRVLFYFKETENYIQVEKEVIFQFNPKFNIVHRNLYV